MFIDYYGRHQLVWFCRQLKRVSRAIVSSIVCITAVLSLVHWAKHPKSSKTVSIRWSCWIHFSCWPIRKAFECVFVCVCAPECDRERRDPILFRLLFFSFPIQTCAQTHTLRHSLIRLLANKTNFNSIRGRIFPYSFSSFSHIGRSNYSSNTQTHSALMLIVIILAISLRFCWYCCWNRWLFVFVLWNRWL